MYQVRLAVVLEAPDPGVLEELADDRSDADPLRQALHAGDERATAPDDEVDLDAGGRGAVEGVDALAIDQGVELEDDAGPAAVLRVLDLAIDEGQESLT